MIVEQLQQTLAQISHHTRKCQHGPWWRTAFALPPGAQVFKRGDLPGFC
jgi:hypothetical protein